MDKYVNFNKGSGMNLPMGDKSGGFLSKIQSAGSSLSSTTIMMIMAFIAFIIIAIVYYYYYVAPSLKPSYTANSEKGSANSNQGKEAELLFFFAEWCPHCKTAKPVWEDLKAEYQNKTINGYRVIFTEINCSTETAEVEDMMNKYKVEGFTTIKLLKDGQVIEYDAKPTKATLSEFLNTVL